VRGDNERSEGGPGLSKSTLGREPQAATTLGRAALALRKGRQSRERNIVERDSERESSERRRRS